MAYDRISTAYTTNQALRYLNANQKTYATSQARLSSGKNILTPSDDPVGTTRLLDISATQAADTRYVKNLDNASAEVDTADSAIQNISSLLQRAKELGVQGASDSLSTSNRSSIAKEVDSLINQAVQLGNTKIGDQYLFSGFKTSTPPFSRMGDVVTYSGSPTSENWQRSTEVAAGIKVTTNVNGDNLLGNTSNTGSVFDVLIKLKQDLAAGNTPNVSSRLDQLDTAGGYVGSQSSTIGTVQNQITLTQNRLGDQALALSSQKSAVQDVDIAKLISDVNLQQTLYQASLSVTAKALQTSLLSYL